MVRNLLHPIFLKILFAVNFFGSIYGYYWYKEQLANTPLVYWIYTPDSPLSTTITAFSLLCLLYKKDVPWLFFLSFATVTKYGLWAVFVNTHYWLISGQMHWQEVMLWISHLGMAGQGILYLLIVPPRLKVWGGVSLWMIWNDYVDYSWNLYPYLYLDEQFPTVKGFTYLLTGIIIILSGWYAYKQKEVS